MARDKGAKLVVTQDGATAPARFNKAGYQVDAWGLPLVGPVRMSVLEAVGLPDPNVDPDAWALPDGKHRMLGDDEATPSDEEVAAHGGTPPEPVPDVPQPETMKEGQKVDG